jgi:hypothetical protein
MKMQTGTEKVIVTFLPDAIEENPTFLDLHRALNSKKKTSASSIVLLIGVSLLVFALLTWVVMYAALTIFHASNLIQVFVAWMVFGIVISFGWAAATR